MVTAYIGLEPTPYAYPYTKSHIFPLIYTKYINEIVTGK